MAEKDKKSIRKKFLLAIGLALAIITIIPLPWRIRCTWARVLTFGRNIIFWFLKTEAIHEFVEAQNIEYKLGKQSSGLYASIKQLGTILEFMEKQNLSFEQLKSILELIESQNLSFEQLKSILEFVKNQNISFNQLKSIAEFAEE